MTCPSSNSPHSNPVMRLIRADGRAAPGVCHELVQATHGNPLAIGDLLELLSPAQLGGGEPLPDPLPAGPRATAAFDRRLRALDAEVASALLVAAASDSGDLAEIHAALAAVELDPGALERAEAAGVIGLTPPELSFRHPLMRSVIYQSAPDAARRRAHGALASVLDDASAGRRAWHLALAAAGPD
ncbi:MAG: helix-turn-helix transcriptional regulator, partial [Solirubrobacteraceae bacterium]